MKRRGFTLVEIMIVILIVGMLLTIAVPSFVKSRAKSQATTCVANLQKIDMAKDQWAIETKASIGDAVTMTDLAPGFLKEAPACPTGGTYDVGVLGIDPTCSIGGTHSL